MHKSMNEWMKLKVTTNNSKIKLLLSLKKNTNLIRRALYICQFLFEITITNFQESNLSIFFKENLQKIRLELIRQLTKESKW